MAGSVWTVSEDQRSLVRMVEPTASAAFEQAIDLPGVASEELRQAWSAAFGRSPNPSDAWDHAIKAVEAALIPVVVPKQAAAQLGHVVGHLDRQGDKFDFVLSTQQGPTSMEVLGGLLRLLWPNPDRHGGDASRAPTLIEAQSVVHLAVTLVQWARTGVLSKRP